MAGKTKVFKDFVQGDSFLIKISHNPVVDLTGATFRVVMSYNPGRDLVLDVTHTAGAHVDDVPGSGIVHIPITSADTAAVDPGKYYGSIIRTIGTNVITILQSGKNNVDTVTCYEKLT